VKRIALCFVVAVLLHAVLAITHAWARMTPVPPPLKVAIPNPEAWCLDAGATATDWRYATKPELRAFGGRANFGPVTPGTCAWLPGSVRQTRIQLACPNHQGGWLLSAPGEFATTPGGAALCAVPAAQDFR
jgi:hypothetical protein